ncbi:unnamed protein product [Bursaphelenchus xylophilus]|uniref:RNA-dependent RNA polymerase n=1 Tax=Bursaphelenchus xylophilus TaxID=6326 RepID=A0A1I7SVZ0_BURXY|nr:unnamed protein product [Bursaphelenchus xylophilus]CAG9098526.1 unnamed protein product [Bursaphelenchus xylophilus]
MELEGELDSRPRRRRQRDILGVNRFDRIPIDERLPLPYEIIFRLHSSQEDPEHIREQFHLILEELPFERCKLEPIIDQALASFEPPRLSQRGTAFLHGILSEIPGLTVRLIQRFIKLAGTGLETQIRLELINLDELFMVLENPRIIDESLECLSLGLGNMPNFGLFIERTTYNAFENSYSNARMINNDLTTVNNIAGSHVLTCWLDINFFKKLLHVTFAVPVDEIDETGLKFEGYKLTLSLSSVREMTFCADFENNSHLLLIRYKTPPQLWKAMPKYHHSRITLNLTDCREWTRVLEVENNSTIGMAKTQLGNCCVLGIKLPKKPPIPADASPYELEMSSHLQNDMINRIYNLLGRIQTIAKTKVFFSDVHRIIRNEVPHIVMPLYDSFRANYAIHGLIERGYSIIDQLYASLESSSSVPAFFQDVAKALEEHQEACEESLEDLLAICDDQRLNSLHYSFKKLFRQKITPGSDLTFTSRQMDVPRNCVLVRKVIVTPLRRIFLPPEVMMSNRVVRHFGEEGALRCSFRDDNGQRLSLRNFTRCADGIFSHAIVEDMVKRTLLRPFDVGGRSFRFLAWSNSQLRDHGCYMFSDMFKENTLNGASEFISVDTIRSWMGDFSKATSVPKLMSRMGQCFTQAQPTIELKKRDWEVVSDFESRFVDPFLRKNYVFSDGVGLISPRFAKIVSAMLDVYPVPSCFQVRFKGFKGILVNWPNLVNRENYKEIVFRESQHKFEDAKEDDKATLEVVKYSMPSQVCLNRPLIMILDQVLQKQNIRRHRAMKRRVTEIVEGELDTLGAMLYRDVIASAQLTTRTASRINFRSLLDSGITLTDEPLFRLMLVAIYKYCIIQDMVKLKVPVPPELGRTMYGVVDELGYLNPGQVFLQCSRSVSLSSINYAPFVGRVLVTKNPCHVPGDVRMFEAVDLKEYHHLRDVIVFPRHGIRPHPDEMAGSDLDGDEYAVFFDSDLFYDQNEAPMHFPKKTAQELNRQPTTEDMVDFFLKYLEQDSIGRVSNAHLVAADQLGIFDKICENLAAKCSVAVDFPKTGEPAEPLTQDERFEVLPDFIGCNTRNVYQSRWLLGTLYRKIHVLEMILESIPGFEQKKSAPPDELLLDQTLKDTEPYMFQEALRHRDVYYAKLQQILDEYGIESEAEMMSGHAVSIRRITDMEKQDYSFYHADRLVEMRVNQIIDNFRREFFDQFGGEAHCLECEDAGITRFIGPEKALLKAQCWYTVAYGEDAENIKFRSFPWIVWDMIVHARKKIRLRVLALTGKLDPGQNMIFKDLTQFILNFNKQNVDDLRAFDHRLMSQHGHLHCYEIYITLYGSKLAATLFFLHHWLFVNNMYKTGGFSQKHLILLVLKFAFGLPIGRYVNQKTYLTHKVETVEEAQTLRGSENAPFKFEECGGLVLEFVRFLGSVHFSLSDTLDFSYDGLTNLTDNGEHEPCCLFNASDWKPISELAYRTFHFVSLTRNFEVFTKKISDLVKL